MTYLPRGYDDELEEAAGRLYLARQAEERAYRAWRAAKGTARDPRKVRDALNGYRRCKIERVYWARRVQDLRGGPRGATGRSPAPGPTRPPAAAAVGAAPAGAPEGSERRGEPVLEVAAGPAGDTQSNVATGAGRTR